MFPVVGILTYCTQLLTMDRFVTSAKFGSGSVLSLFVSLSESCTDTFLRKVLPLLLLLLLLL